MTISLRALTDALASHALASGYFESVNQFEAPSAPSATGLTAAVFPERLRALAVASGLASTSALLPMTIRLYKAMTSRPLDQIDPDMLDATDALCAAYVGDFTLGGLIRNADVLGEFGSEMEAVFGWVDIADAKYRVVDITVGLVINDAWTQAP